MTHIDKIRAALDAARGVHANVMTAALAALAALAELEREPTDEECERIYADWLHAETHGSTAGRRMGRAMFNAVHAVIGGKP